MTYSSAIEIDRFHILKSEHASNEEEKTQDTDDDSSSGEDYTLTAIFKGSKGRISEPVKLQMKKVGEDFVYNLSDDENTLKTELDFPVSGEKEKEEDRELSESNKGGPKPLSDYDIIDQVKKIHKVENTHLVAVVVFEITDIDGESSQEDNVDVADEISVNSEDKSDKKIGLDNPSESGQTHESNDNSSQNSKNNNNSEIIL